MDIHSNLSIVIPNHNEVNIESVKYWCSRFFPNAEIIIENDITGVGKGATLRNGLKKTTKEWIVFLDGDLDIFPSEINKLIDMAKKADIVVGTKSIYDMPFKRKMLSLFSRLLIKGLFWLPVSDTQTGIKLFKRETLINWKTNGYAFDIEILRNAHKLGYIIKEVKINLMPKKTMKLKTVARTLCETISLWFQL